MSIYQLADFKSVPEISCVYAITHASSTREYIGRSVNLRDRARKHWQELLADKHKNPKITNTYKKHGPDFSIRPLIIGDIEYCTLIEGLLLERIDLKESFNCHRSSSGGWYGLEWSEESRKKLSISRIGKKQTEATKERQRIARLNSEKVKKHIEYLCSEEVHKRAVELAASPESRAKAVETRRVNGFKPFSDEIRAAQRERAKGRLFDALNWAVANNATRDEALNKFHCSWGSLRLYQPEWEEINGPLNLPKRASGERNGLYKHGLSKEKRRKKTEDELENLRKKRSEMMSGENNPMYGRTHTEEAKAIIAERARETAKNRIVSDETRLKLSESLKGKPKPKGADSKISKPIMTPDGKFDSIRIASAYFNVTDGAIIFRLKSKAPQWSKWNYIEKQGTPT